MECWIQECFWVEVSTYTREDKKRYVQEDPSGSVLRPDPSADSYQQKLQLPWGTVLLVRASAQVRSQYVAAAPGYSSSYRRPAD